MKTTSLLFVTLFLCVTFSYAQIKVTKITNKNEDHFITTTIGYPVTGTYLYAGKTEPVIQLNAAGTGIFQFEDLSKKNIVWGIECTEAGTPIFIDGFDSAKYSFWYKTNDSKNNSDSAESTDWVAVQFSIHFNKNKMYIMGERAKDFTTDEPQKEILKAEK